MAIADAWIHVICLRDWLIKKAAEKEEEEEAEIRGLASCDAGFHTSLVTLQGKAWGMCKYSLYPLQYYNS